MSSFLIRIQAVIPVAMPAMKEMSVLGLQYAVEQHTVLDVMMDIMPSQILIPQNGVYQGYVLLLKLLLKSMQSQQKITMNLPFQ